MSVWDPKQTLDSIGVGGVKKEEGQKRSSRVAHAIQQELSSLLIEKISDPRLQTAFISRVEVTDDLSQAKIYYTAIGEAQDIQAAGKGFQRAAGFIRSHIAKTINLRFTPALQFRFDETADKVAELENIFQEIAKEREKNGDDS